MAKENIIQLFMVVKKKQNLQEYILFANFKNIFIKK